MGYFDYTKEKDFLICIDSDGCAMDTMNSKHFNSFGPEFVKSYDLEEYKGNGDISVDRPGAYTIVFARTSDKYHIHAFDSVVVHHVVKDETNPVVKGVANGKTYKKAVTIKFSDIDSGIKSAKLNGKSIKSGKKITKSGNYTLVVIDKAGNKVTIKFKVKINKK